MSDYIMLVRMLFFLDDRFQNAHVDATIVYSEVSYEKTEKSPPSNKNIPVRNLKDHMQTCLLMIALDSRVNMK